MQENKIMITPSIMCTDLCNLESSVQKIQNVGFNTLHIDVIDSHFSPSMPLGLDTIKQLRKVTDMNFDVHVMSENNTFFIKELLEIGVQQITFHIESSIHVDYCIKLIKNEDVKVGIALNPSTSLSLLDYILPQCDTILLMLINPGFATNKNETQVFYAQKKIEDLNKTIESKNLNTNIQVDGRVSLDTVANLSKAGANIFVAGSTSLFSTENTMKENKIIMENEILKGLALKGDLY